jgi:hypothetical protein
LTVKTDFPFPSDSYVTMLKDLCVDLEGPDSFQPEVRRETDIWAANVYCSRGEILEKAGFARIHIVAGTREGAPADISFFQTLVYPRNPCLPGFIVMTNMSETETMGRLLVCYTDLINQNRSKLADYKTSFSKALNEICNRHGQSFEEHNAFSSGQNLLGGAAGECGVLCFGEEKDLPFLDEVIRGATEAYASLIRDAGHPKPQAEDFENLYLSRARMIEWILTDDYGIKISRENQIPMSLLEAYVFPPIARY